MKHFECYDMTQKSHLKPFDRIRIFFAVVCLVGLFPFVLNAVSAASKEYQIKAVFLFNFVQFVEWPASSFPKSDTPISICILGDDPFGSFLDETIRGESVNNRKIVVQRTRNLEDLKKCHLVFVSKSEKNRIDQILSAINRAPVLTVGEINNFAERGGILNFYLEANKVRFEINSAVAERGKLKLSSQLLSLGKIVSSKEISEKGK